jgi:hypothetical protein
VMRGRKGMKISLKWPILTRRKRRKANQHMK